MPVLRVLLTLVAIPAGAVPPHEATPPEVRYRLTARLDDGTGVVSGTAEILYRHREASPLASLTLALGHNGFRPGARGWPARTLAGPEDAGYQRVESVRVDGIAAALEWPDTPDSSHAVLRLTRPLEAGDSVSITLAWTGRPPALDWRRERHGRRVDLIGWYPQVLDQTSGTTVPFPAFATLLLDLDLADDQVVGGTGVPVCGDPGWARAVAFPNTPVSLQRNWYATPRDPAAARAACDAVAPGRKRVIWYAEDVTELALALSPTFQHEEGDFLEQPVHTFYERGDERVWGAGLASRRAEAALAWVFELGGRNPWPHLTVIQGLDGTGRALPMVLFGSEPTQAALLRLLGLMITQQVMAGGDRTFTEGTAAYQTTWFFEALGRRGDYRHIEREILDWDLDRRALRDEPLMDVGIPTPCGTTACRRFEFVSHQLRRWAGGDAPVRALYETLYIRFRLRPTVPGAFQETARAVVHPDPTPLYSQLPRGALYDDAIVSVRREPGAGDWRTTAVIERRAAGLFPQTLWVVADSDTVVAHATALTPRETLTVVTRTRPRRVILDPLVESHDWNMLNNQRSFAFRPGWLLLTPNRPRALYFDTYFSRRIARDRATLGWAPTIWYSDAGGWTLGARLREDYLDRFEQNRLWTSLTTGWNTEERRTDLGGRLELRNPVRLRAAGWSEALELAWEEGRAMARAELTRTFRGRISDSSWRSVGLAVRWLAVTDPAYVDPRYYDDAGTAEVSVAGRLVRPGGDLRLALEADLAGGYAYPNETTALTGGGYGRATVAGSARYRLGPSLEVAARVYGGTTVARDSALRQRRIYLAGADPYARFGSPFLRSKGSILTGSWIRYHAPGGAGVRGLDPRVSGDRVAGASLDVEYVVSSSPLVRFMNRAAVAVFADVALADGDLDPPGGRLRSVGDAGVGVRLGHRIGQTRFLTRFDFPLWVSRPELAQDRGPSHPLGLRWSVSFVPAY